MHLTSRQLAESFGVAERVIEDWVRREGMPFIQDRGRLLFDRGQIVAWATERGLAAEAGFLASQQPALHAGPGLEPLLRTGGIWRDIPARALSGLIEKVLGQLPGASPAILELLRRRLRAPEGISWGPVGGGLALPHLRAPVTLGRDSGVFALIFLRDALALATPDHAPVNRLLFFVAPSPRAHLELLGQLSAALTRGRLRRLVLEAAPDEQIFAELAAAEDAQASNEKES
jgi:nitrogen PTS system EIIA component